MTQDNALVFEPSPQLEAFLAAEIRNESDGGISPTTLGSALDSLLQMPQDVLATLNPQMQALGANAEALENELRELISRFGPDFEVEPEIPDEVLRPSPASLTR